MHFEVNDHERTLEISRRAQEINLVRSRDLKLQHSKTNKISWHLHPAPQLRITPLQGGVSMERRIKRKLGTLPV
jgi:hypothetical protein